MSAALVNKNQLAAALGWTRPKLDRRIKSDVNFPTKKRGTRGGGWEFDVSDVRRYLEHSHVAGLVAGALEKKWRARRWAIGELVELGPLRQDLSAMFVILGKGLDDLPSCVAKRLELPDENAEAIRELVDELRRSVVGTLRKYTENDGGDTKS